MSRADVLDLRYEHETRAVPAQANAPSRPRPQSLGLAARLRGLKTLMDAERGTLAAWMALPHGALS